MANNPNGLPARGEKTITCARKAHGKSCGAVNNAAAAACFACGAGLKKHSKKKPAATPALRAAKKRTRK